MTAVTSRRRLLGAAAGLLVLPLLAACPGQQQPAEEVEDCDVDDLAEGDEDCYGDSGRRRKKSTDTKQKSTNTKPRR